MKDTLHAYFRARMGDKANKVFPQDEVDVLLDSSMATLNGYLPSTKQLRWQDKDIERFSDVLVQGAVVTALASKALVECGREFVIKDDGAQYSPPQISNLLMTQWVTESRYYVDRLNIIRSTY